MKATKPAKTHPGVSLPKRNSASEGPRKQRDMEESLATQRRVLMEEEYPPLVEIYRVAASLAGRYKTDEILGHGKVALEAIALWEACRDEYRFRIRNQAEQAMGYLELHDLRERLKNYPKKFPVTFKEFLRVVVGGKYMKARETEFEMFARDMMKSEGQGELTPDHKIQIQIESFDQQTFDRTALEFLRWRAAQAKRSSRKSDKGWNNAKKIA